MTTDAQEVLAYLRAPARACWRWADQGTVLVWHDGSTIAFREEIALVLEALAPQGLPPFDAVVLFLAACRGKYLDASYLPQIPSAGGESRPGAGASPQHRSQLEFLAELEHPSRELQRISQLPPELMRDVRGKAVLAQALFEAAALEQRVEAAVVLRGMRELSSFEALDAGPDPLVGARHLRHLEALSHALMRYTPESLMLRLRTGLDALPDAAQLKLAPGERARRLLNELSQDPEHAGLVQAARELMAAIRLPRRLTAEDALPVGGVADISNRGSLDRLLISELAQEDLTLALRIALKEALYLRREPLTREPPRALVLLLDSGVRLWGLPRVYAAAVALALVARDVRRATVNVWRAHAKSLAPVDLLTKAGLIQHLGVTETPAHPGSSLPALQQAVPKSAGSQSVLITHRDVLRDPAFRQALAATAGVPGFVATVDREGRFELHAVPLTRRQPLCSARLDLERIFAEHKPTVPLVDAHRDPGFPVIFQVRPFPLLLPVNDVIEKASAFGQCSAFVTENACIFLRRHPAEGARQLAANIPGQETVWLHTDKQGRVTALRANRREGCLWIIRAEAGSRWSAQSNHDYLVQWHSNSPGLVDADSAFGLGLGGVVLESVQLQKEVLLVVDRARTIAIHAGTGETLGLTLNPPGFFYRSGRYFQQGADWLFVSWNGRAIVWEPVSLPAPLRKQDVLMLFDREGCEGPLALTQQGGIWTSQGEPVLQIHRMVSCATSSEDGHRLLLTEEGSGNCYLVNLNDKGGVSFLPNVSWDQARRSLEPTTDRLRRPIWADFKCVHAREPAVLALYRARGSGVQLTFNEDDIPCVRPLTPQAARPATSLHFRPVPAPPEAGCTLQVAEWPNGSRAFLDSRGLLHLKSSNPAVAEVTLVLTTGVTALWSSDGLVWGPRFFVGDAPRASPKELRRRVAAFVDRLW